MTLTFKLRASIARSNTDKFKQIRTNLNSIIYIYKYPFSISLLGIGMSSPKAVFYIINDPSEAEAAEVRQMMVRHGIIERKDGNKVNSIQLILLL